jgi:hypothetical protein
VGWTPLPSATGGGTISTADDLIAAQNYLIENTWIKNALFGYDDRTDELDPRKACALGSIACVVDYDLVSIRSTETVSELRPKIGHRPLPPLLLLATYVSPKDMARFVAATKELAGAVREMDGGPTTALSLLEDTFKVSAFNDDETVTFEDVMDMFDRAIVRAKERELCGS